MRFWALRLSNHPLEAYGIGWRLYQQPYIDEERRAMKRVEWGRSKLTRRPEEPADEVEPDRSPRRALLAFEESAMMCLVFSFFFSY